MIYHGSCHCGRIAFDVEGDLGQVMSCNCSICRRKGALMWFVPRQQLRLLTPEADMSTYTFNKHVIQHHFCPTCGMHPFGEGRDPAGNAMAAVNVRCLDDVDLDTLTVKHFDGRAL
ncbi:glutathione-dependent formaldehyde-activating GFA [Pseudogulbenkiania sp. NH8B]|uniref:Glutathione-dependent formaldehyde-activating GFA n=1 Tax=Pseudogulbenkiania ferrooxidans 2002 TaxID=279714 RepID=B9Z1C6_9NEIS|nr:MULTISPECIES: GFA family protein [Pseudogulbenkiania]EEG09221.1 glutathione-dependent formaldehyde-activating GFA [Pseudogulbenkiania ferrooxidans 2002]BAK75736.1 glutathione-dependent formaldehyde-activating GFA [Pseudogulbenkiania sp. NH8B]